jgi:hypothetical protein
MNRRGVFVTAGLLAFLSAFSAIAEESDRVALHHE